MNDAEIEKELWSIANTITAFSVLQCVAILYASTKGDLQPLLNDPLLVKAVVASSLLWSTVYCLGIWGCHRLACRLPTPQPAIWRSVTFGRLVAVLCFQTVAACAFYVIN